MFKHRRFDGQVAALFLVLSGLTRFGMEFLRGDPRGGLAGLATSHWIGLLMLAAGATWLVHGWRETAAHRDQDAVRRSFKPPASSPWPT